MVKVQFSISIDQDLLDWVEDKVREGKFESISDGIRTCIQKCIQLEGKHGEA